MIPFYKNTIVKDVDIKTIGKNFHINDISCIDFLYDGEENIITVGTHHGSCYFISEKNDKVFGAISDVFSDGVAKVELFNH
jgi:hypothetical protein